MRQLAIALFLSMSATGMFAQNSPADEDAVVYFANIEDGAVVDSPVRLVFGLRYMGVAPAGVEIDFTGHHHLLINRPAFGEGPDDAAFSEGVPADDNHMHFGGGETEVDLELPPGTHTLQLLLGDHAHVPHDPPVFSDVITITVQ